MEKEIAESVLRDLARVRALFQLRAIEAIMRGPVNTPTKDHPHA